MGSSFFWGVAGAIGTVVSVLVTIASIFIPLIFSRRTLTYELRAATPLMDAPVAVNPDLHIEYNGKPLRDPRVIVVRLVYHGWKDLPSTAFDQGDPLNLDVKIEIAALLQSNFTPSQKTPPKVQVNGARIEIGPSLIRKNLEMEFVVLTDGAGALLDCYGSLADVKIRKRTQEAVKSYSPPRLQPISALASLAFIILLIWWIIENPTGSAHLMANIRAGLAGIGHLIGILHHAFWKMVS